jgi:NAD(P)-dependent dehydrogenase (short-subunit alcohol dehydrogenase family)
MAGMELMRNAVVRHDGGLVLGQPCGVADYEQVRALWDAAVKCFGGADVWIHDAGIEDPGSNFWEIPAERIDEVVRANLLGVMHGSKVAMRGMLEQGYAQVYNMEGLRRDGRFVRPGALVYVENDRHGAQIDWLSRHKLAWRLARLQFNTGDPFAEKTKELRGGRA